MFLQLCEPPRLPCSVILSDVVCSKIIGAKNLCVLHTAPLIKRILHVAVVALQILKSAESFVNQIPLGDYQQKENESVGAEEH